MTKAFLKEHNIAYEERDVSTNAAAREEMIEKSGQMGVPVIKINDRIIVGFDKKSLSDFLPIK